MASPILNATDAKQPLFPGQWQAATWQDYLYYRDTLNPDQFRLFFHQGYLLIIEMGWEGIDHAAICDLFTMIFGFWFGLHSGQTATSLGRCLLEREKTQSGAPDLVLYLDEKKQLYAALGIAEYWVIDVRGQRVFAFNLQANGKYKTCEQSQVLSGLPISILENTVMRLSESSNISAAAWFNQQLPTLVE